MWVVGWCREWEGDSAVRNVPTFWSLSEVNNMERNAVVLHALGLPVCSDRAESMKVEA